MNSQVLVQSHCHLQYCKLLLKKQYWNYDLSFFTHRANIKRFNLESKQEYKKDLDERLKNMLAGESGVAAEKGEPIDNEKSSLEETYNSVNSKLILESEKLEKNFQLQFEERMCVEKRRIYQEMWKRVQVRDFGWLLFLFQVKMKTI